MMLTVEDTAKHFSLTPETIRSRIKTGELRAQRINRAYRLEWQDVWTCERGPMPKGRRIARYRMPLVTKFDVAEELCVSVKSVERMIDDSLPTRNVWGSVRMNPADVKDWLAVNLGIELTDDWHIRQALLRTGTISV